MTTLAEFLSQISSEVKRGTTLDSLIPQKLAMAVRQMERAHVFLHTEKFSSLLIASADPNPRTIAQPVGFRGMYFWRVVSATISPQATIYSRINHVDPTDVSEMLTGMPTAYWQDGNEFFWLDNIPDQDYNTELSYNAFTVLPTDTSQSPQIIQDYPDVLMFWTMVLMAPNMRNADVSTFYKPLRDEAMKSAIDNDVEQRQQYRSESMQYGWEFKEDINNSLLKPPTA